MLDALGHAIARVPRTVVAIWVVVTLAAYGVAFGWFGNASLFEQLTTGPASDPLSDSHAADEILTDAQDTGDTLGALVTGVDPANPGIGLIMADVHAELDDMPAVEFAVSPYVLPGGPSNPAAADLLARDGDGFAVVVTLLPDQEPEAVTAVADYLAGLDLVLPDPTVTVQVGGYPLILDAITAQVEQDLRTGEAIALPFALLAMVIVFGGFLAASMPLIGALAAIAGGLVILLITSHAVDLEAAMVNVVSVLGLGLSIDYGLLVVSRFRSELAETILARQGRSMRRRRRDTVVADALGRTMATAGRTVLFSALIIAISLAGLGVFRPALMRTFAIAAVSVVLFALLTALTLVPAMLAMAGRSLLKPSPLAKVPVLGRALRAVSEADADEGGFARLAGRVQRRPWLVLALTSVLLLALASPLLHLRTQHTDITMLPIDNPQRQYLATLADQYPRATAAPIQIVADASDVQANAWAEEVAALDSVARVDPAAVLPNGYTLIGVYVPSTPDPPVAQATAVHDIRALDPTFTALVTGEAARLADFNAALLDGLPWALTVVLLATGLLLFLLTGSVFVPLKAIVTNLLSMGASLGVLVWGFQEGHLEDLLDFTSPGAVYVFILALAVAITFGLSMDYEVFLISRVKEMIDAGYDNDEAVRRGLQRSGRVITSAAFIIVVVFLGFVSGDLLIIKQIGVVLAVAVFIDATIVRLLLVPAVMKLAGQWNWWAPEPLRRLHARLGLHD